MASSSSTSSLLRKQAVAPVLNVCVWCARLWLGIRKRVGPGTVVFRAPPFKGCCGGVLLSHTLPGAVPSALAGLASRFGMETGRFPAAMTTTSGSTSIHLSPPMLFRGGCVGCDPHSGDEHFIVSVNHTVYTFVVEVFVSVGPLVPVGSRAPRGASTSGLSTR